MVMYVPVAVAAAVIVGTLSTPTISSQTKIDPLPVGWRADIGIPVAYDDTYIFLYGDTIPSEGGLARNTAIIDETIVSPALADTTSGSWYWPTDGITLLHRELFVIALEMREGGELGYEVADTDAFVVSDPRSNMSWKLATKIEDGPWGAMQVQFSDQWPLAFMRDPYGLATSVYEIDPSDPTAPWVDLDGDLPDSHGVFAPIQTEGGWFGYTWTMWFEHALWVAENATGPWVEVETFTTEQRTYDHGMSVVDGELVHRWSQGEGDQRVMYETVDL